MPHGPKNGPTTCTQVDPKKELTLDLETHCCHVVAGRTKPVTKPTSKQTRMPHISFRKARHTISPLLCEPEPVTTHTHTNHEATKYEPNDSTKSDTKNWPHEGANLEVSKKAMW